MPWEKIDVDRAVRTGEPLVTWRRPSWDETWGAMAEVIAERGTCPRQRVGAVVVDGRNRVIAVGYNGAPRHQPHCLDVGCDIGPDGGCQRAFHAEQNALFFAGRDAEGAALYTTLSPCFTCAKLIVTAGVRRVVATRAYRTVDGVPDPVAYLRECGVEVTIVR